MPRTHIGLALTLASAVATAVAVCAAGPDPPSVAEGPALKPWTAARRLDAMHQYRYSLTARVRPLLFWISRTGVGSGRILRAEPAGGTMAFEFLIGSDPARAPMRINRWGYILETHTGDRTDVVGVMTEANEQTPADGTRTLAQSPSGGRSFKAIRASIGQGQATAEVLRVSLAGDPTFRDLSSVLGRLPEGGPATARLSLPAGTRSGFLAAVAELVAESVGGARAAGDLNPPRRRQAAPTVTYVWDRGLYDLALESSRAERNMRVGDVVCEGCLESEFRVRNRLTGTTSRFSLTYPIGGPLSGVPLRIVYRPRWWFEAELTLQEVP